MFHMHYMIKSYQFCLCSRFWEYMNACIRQLVGSSVRPTLRMYKSFLALPMKARKCGSCQPLAAGIFSGSRKF